jgi:hypothetical protein
LINPFAPAAADEIRMSDSGMIIAMVTILVCVLAAAGVMGRTAMERRRIVERYEHLKKVFRLRDEYSVKLEEERRLKAEEEARVARKADLLGGLTDIDEIAQEEAKNVVL